MALRKWLILRRLVKRGLEGRTFFKPCGTLALPPLLKLGERICDRQVTLAGRAAPVPPSNRRCRGLGYTSRKQVRVDPALGPATPVRPTAGRGLSRRGVHRILPAAFERRAAPRERRFGP